MVPFLLPVLDVPGPSAHDPADPPAEVRAAESPSTPAHPRPRLHDALFPGGGRVNLSLASGLPFVAVSEIAVGVGDRFAFGALGGATPEVPGFGVRPRLAVFDSGRFRGVLAVPALYYPFTTDGGSPWVLARPTFVLEHAWDSGVRLGGGMAAIAATSTDHRKPGYGSHNIKDGIWNTVNVTFAMPVAEKTSLFAEGALVMSGVRIAEEWAGVVPFTFAAGVATRLF